MAKKSPPELTAELYYSVTVCDKLGALAAEGSPAANRRIAQQHAAILGLALHPETSSSLAVEQLAMPACLFSSDASPYSYKVRLTENLTHIASAFRECAHTPPQEIWLDYSAVAPTPDKTSTNAAVNNPLTNNWLYSSVLEPAMTRRYTWNGASCTLRERLLAVAAMSDAELIELADDGPASKRHHIWLMNKGVMLWGIPRSHEARAPDTDHISVRCFTAKALGNLMAVLSKQHGGSALEQLKIYAGPAGHYAPNGEFVVDFVLHRIK